MSRVDIGRSPPMSAVRAPARVAPKLTVALIQGNVNHSVKNQWPRQPTQNLRRNPHASLCVINERFFGEWHTVDGTVEIVSLPEAMEPLLDYYRRSVGEHPDWDDYRAAMERERRVLLRLTVERSGPTKQG